MRNFQSGNRFSCSEVARLELHANDSLLRFARMPVCTINRLDPTVNIPMPERELTTQQICKCACVCGLNEAWVL